MGNLEAAVPAQLPLTEAAFRRMAGLCRHCGMARTDPESALCSYCNEQAEIRQMHEQWAKWEIAA